MSRLAYAAVLALTTLATAPAVAGTDLPLGVFVGNPNGNDTADEHNFEQAYAAFGLAMGGACVHFMNAFTDGGVDPSEWGSSAGWNAWSWTQTGSNYVGLNARIIPVVGIPFASNDVGGKWENIDNFYKGVIAGQYDSDYKAIVDAWANAGFDIAYFRFAYEFNGNFMPWAPGNSSSPTAQDDFKQAWAHVADLIHQAGKADGIAARTVWNPGDSIWGTPPSQFYPGDQYVDVMATDVYSPTWTPNLTTWSASDASGVPTGTAPDQTTWAANPVNRAHFWQYPNANAQNPTGTPGSGWSFTDMVNFATAHNKPLAMGETGAGGDGGKLGPVDDPAFPQWLAGALHQAVTKGVRIVFVNIWDVNLSDGGWQFSGAGANKPQEAAAWKQYFGSGQAAQDQLVLSISEDRYPNGDAFSDANGDATFVVRVDSKQIGGTMTATAMHSSGQTQSFTVNGNFGPGQHLVEVQLTNDAWNGTSSPTTDRNIYVDGVTYNGKAVAYTGHDVNGSGAWFNVSQ